MKLAHLFLPHPKTHKKAHLLSEKSLLIYLLLFVALQFAFKGIARIQPGVLGTTSAITAGQVIELTNEERQKSGLPLLKENQELDKAADEKAKICLLRIIGRITHLQERHLGYGSKIQDMIMFMPERI